MLILISNSPRILISRQTIGIEIDNSIAYRYAALHLLPSICYPVTMSFITSVHYVIMAFVPLLLCLYILLSIMSLWLLFPCYCVFTYSVHSVIMASASFYLSFRLLLCKLFLSSYHFVDNRLNRGGEISSLFVSHF